MISAVMDGPPRAGADDSEYGIQPARFGALSALKRRLHGASTVGELLAMASVEAVRACGFERGVVLAVEDGQLTASGIDAIEAPASDAMRRQMLAHPVPLAAGSPEAELIRRAEGFKRSRGDGPANLSTALGLREHVLVPVVPESQAVALVVLDRSDPPVSDEDQSSVELFAHLLGLAVERVVLRLRMQEVSTELRHLSTSALALMNEALEAPIMLPADQGQGPVFFTAVAGQYAAMPANVRELLSDREREIANLMVGGRSNREIGEELHLSPDTVKAHVARLVRKLGASNRVEAVARYVTMMRGSDP